MDPKDIELDDLNKIFEYERISRELDTCTNIDIMKNLCKCYVKLYFKQQETISLMHLDQFKVE